MKPREKGVSTSASLIRGVLLTGVSYRFRMTVSQVMIFQTLYGQTAYYVCPRCRVTMEREFMAFCDRCGQRLDWRSYETATIIYPNTSKSSD